MIRLIKTLLMNLNLISSTMSIPTHVKKIRLYKHKIFVEDQVVSIRFECLGLVMRYATGIIKKEQFMEQIDRTAEILKKRETYLNEIKRYIT